MSMNQLIDNIPEGLRFKINHYVKLNSYDRPVVLRTINDINVKSIAKGQKLNLFINLEPVNNIRGINKFHQEVYDNLNGNQIYICCGETITQRSFKFRNNIRFGFKNIFLVVDFFFKRVFPKLPLSKSIYFAITRGHNRVLSKAEILGRVSSCGFKILNVFNYENKIYVISKKIKIVL